MLKVRIIPVLLFKNWGIVKSKQFSEMRVVGDPTTNARVFNERNADEMIFLDILASRENKDPNFLVIENIAKECFMPLTIGGGIKTIEHVDRLFDIGADKISLNSIIFEKPDLVTQIAKKYGSQAVVASIDTKLIDGQYATFSLSGTKKTKYSVCELAEYVESLGVGEILLNSIDRDGMANGYDLNLISAVNNSCKLPIIACGGCGCAQDLVDAIKHGADAVAAATIFYYVGESIISVKKYLQKNGIAVRLL